MELEKLYFYVEGFRDLPWGTRLITLTGFVELETNSGLKDVKEYN